jgi:hypothetical protein
MAQTSVTAFIYKERYAYDAGNKAEYLGWALPGPGTATSGTASAIWRIAKLTYSGNNVISILFANGSKDFAYVWDSRTSYAYN